MARFEFRPRKPRIRVVEKKLGRESAWGQAQMPNLIELDPSLKGSRHLVYLIHEALHLAKWDLSEAEVDRIAIEVGEVVWRQNYRRVSE